MADFHALETLINAYIKKNGVQAITGQILNGVLRGMVSALGKGYTVAGVATPSTDPGTMTGPVAYYASQAGTYADFDNIVVNDGEVALLIYDESVWHKEVMLSLNATASIDGNVGVPAVDVSFENGLLTFDFRNLKGNTGAAAGFGVIKAEYYENGGSPEVSVLPTGPDTAKNLTFFFQNLKGNPGDAAGFGTPTATVDANVGTPGVSVSASGPDTAKVFAFQFTNLKGEQGIQGIQGIQGVPGPAGVSSVVVTVDNTSGNPACTASLSSGVLTLAFTGLKGAQGDTGSSVDYPFTIVNNLTTDDATQALSAAMGVQLEGEVSQLELKVDGLDKSQDFEFAIAVGSVDYTKNVDIKAGKYNITLVDANGALPEYARLYLDGTSIGYVASISNPYTIVSDVSVIRIWASASATTSGNITVKFTDAEPVPSIDDKIDAVNDKADGISLQLRETDLRLNASCGSTKDIGIVLTMGVQVMNTDFHSVNIPKNTQFTISLLSSLSDYITDNNIPIYVKYEDGTTEQIGGVYNSTPLTTQKTKNIIGISTYISWSHISTSGTIQLQVTVTSNKDTAIFDGIDKNSKIVLKLKHIGTTVTYYDDYSVGDLFYYTNTNTVVKIVAISPTITVESIGSLDSNILYFYQRKLWYFDGVGLSPVESEETDYTPIFKTDKIEVGATTNNDGDAQYIYKNIGPFSITKDEVIAIECESVENAVSTSPIRVYGYKNGVRTQIVGYGNASQKRIVALDSEYDSAAVVLFASTSGGLTDENAVYNGLNVFKSRSGNYDLAKGYAPYDDLTIPAYFLANNYIANKIATIRLLMAAANGNFDAFIFDTDQHWPFNYKTSPAVIKYLTERLTINRMFMGGDMADGIDLNGYFAFKRGFNGRIYYTAGNHEYMDRFCDVNQIGNSIQTITDTDIWLNYQSHMEDAVIGDANKNYYYVDNPVQKMRYIILSVYADGSVGRFEQAQEDWLNNVALNLPSGYTAIVFAHYIASQDHETYEKTVSPNGQKIIDAVENYTGDGAVAVLLAGHTHWDLVYTSPNGTNVVVTTCDKGKPIQDFDEWLVGTREGGTITEIAFDVVIVDKTNRLVSCVRIGAPAYNDGGDSLELRQVSY